MSNKLKVGFTIDLKSLEQIEKIPETMRFKALDKALAAAGEVVAQRARQVAPDGRRSGNSEKRSKKQASEANWERQLKDMIGYVIRKRTKGGQVIVGPIWQLGGSKSHFNYGAKVYEEGRVQYYWGKPGTTYVRQGKNYTPIKATHFKQTRNFMKQALDETQDAAIQAFVNSLEQAMANG
jgi:hypothetical protein